MRLTALLLAGILMTVQLAAQDQEASPTEHAAPSTQETPATGLPVSLDRIREGLATTSGRPPLQLDRQADFRVEVQERTKIEEILKTLDFTSGPAPAGGLYGYEQQRRLFNPVDRPLMQPYAAFNGGELITVAIENLMAQVLGTPLTNAAGRVRRTQADQAAKDEADQAVADYCASRSDRAAIQLCQSPDR
jgi:hypothetical protein